MSANAKARQVQGNGTYQNTIAPSSTEQAMLLKQDEIIAALNGTADTSQLSSAAGAGGGATEAMTVTGLLASDEIVSVTQKTPGANSLPLLGWSTQAANTVTGIWSADPGAGAVLQVAFKRAKSVSSTELAAVTLKGG